MTAKEILLVRHGKTEWNKTMKYLGRTDLPLSAEGAAQLCRAGIQCERVYVSPMLRAKQTAEILFPGAKQLVIGDFREMDFGEFEGRSYLDMRCDADYRAWVDGGCRGRCPGGEDMEEFSGRVCAAFEKLMREHDGEKLIIVAHGGTQMTISARYLRPETDYFSGGTGTGEALRLDAADWEKNRTLRLCERLSFNSEML